MTNGFWLGRVFGLWFTWKLDVHWPWIKDRKSWKLKWKMRDLSEFLEFYKFD